MQVLFSLSTTLLSPRNRVAGVPPPSSPSEVLRCYRDVEPAVGRGRYPLALRAPDLAEEPAAQVYLDGPVEVEADPAVPFEVVRGVRDVVVVPEARAEEQRPVPVQLEREVCRPYLAPDAVLLEEVRVFRGDR